MKTIKAIISRLCVSSLLSGIIVFNLSTANVSAQSQPANTLSIITYGASTGSSDNTSAIQSCINAAQTQGKGVWIPSGTYKVTGSLSATGILIAGAGMTSSVIYRQKSGSTDTTIHVTRCTVQDLGVDGNGTARGVNADYGFSVNGVGWLMQRVQIQHSDAGMWATGSSGTIQNCVVTNTFADGLNINNSDGPNGLGANLTIQSCKGYHAGDDEFAINSQIPTGSGRVNMVNAKVLNCVSSGAYAANGVRIAGGTNSTVQNNFITNAYQSDIICGIFGGEGSIGGIVQNAVISGNTCVGGGTNNDNEAGIRLQDNSTATVTGNTIKSTLKYGVTMSDGTYTFNNNTINHPGLTGLWIESGARGSATIKTNTVQSLNSGQVAFLNSATGTFTTTLSGNSWQTGTGVMFFSDINYGGTASQTLGVGTYTLSQLAALGCANDSASSVRVPSGRTLIMYSDDNFSGTSWTLTSDTPNFTTLSPNANDTVSSCKVQ
ncbi:MAG TPA: right-handed parallel beta-helix repeat-containing protein [Verrucomicrobiae bacterium]|jgi:hypothetical protein|nr:right-handed parallel beta-helix repeat-containing protein [Verrucomicrobiae bacterium]